MIASHTLAVPGVATQLPYLLKQARMADHPLWLTTTEEDTEPIAVVIEVSKYERTQNLLYEWQLLHLKQCLDRVEKFWDNELLKEECIHIWQENTWKLWEVAPKPVRAFVTGLTMSAQKLDMQTFSKDQVSALQYALAAIHDGTLNRTDLQKAYRQLIRSGISPRLSFDEDLIQLYLDEL